MTRLRLFALIASLAFFIFSAAKFWESKPYTEWSEKEALKVLNDSPWGETYTLTDTTQMFYQPTPRTAAPGGEQNINREVFRHFRIRWLSARPVRMAISRLTALRAQQENRVDAAGEQRLNDFVNSTFIEHVVLGIETETNEPKYRGELFSLFAAMTLADLKNNTYLVRAGDNKKNFISEYHPPAESGLGARFVFPRNVDGEPFVSERSGTIRFVTNLRERYNIQVPFKPKEMLYEGKIEY